MLQNLLRADGRVYEIHLLLAALVAPDERGANDTIILIKQDKAVHLA
jgi:hypothetical protein